MTSEIDAVLPDYPQFQTFYGKTSISGPLLIEKSIPMHLNQVKPTKESD